jgi:hypothetical protein
MILAFPRILLASLAAALLLAQQSAPKFEFCGLGSKHDCSCVRRVQAIRQTRFESCQTAALERGEDPDKADCFKDVASHCSLAESRQSEDGEDLAWNQEKGEFEGNSKMGALCTMACKSHDCKCDDGPECHFGHQASDHEVPKRKK